MKNLLSFVLLTLAVVSAYAQENQLQIQQNKTSKIKVKGNKLVIRDKSKPVRQALEMQYAKIAEAQKNKDIERLRSLSLMSFLS